MRLQTMQWKIDQIRQHPRISAVVAIVILAFVIHFVSHINVNKTVIWKDLGNDRGIPVFTNGHAYEICSEGFLWDSCKYVDSYWDDEGTGCIGYIDVSDGMTRRKICGNAYAIEAKNVALKQALDYYNKKDAEQSSK